MATKDESKIPVDLFRTTAINVGKLFHNVFADESQTLLGCEIRRPG